MKNKGLTYGLLIVVGIVWYQVFVRIKSNITEDNIEVLEPKNSTITFKHIKKRKPTYILADYRDPFLNVLESKLAKDSIENNQSIKPIIPKVKEKIYVDWPKIKYHGFVKKVDSKKPRVILEIDNYLFKIQVGESILDDIVLIRADRESVNLSYQKERKEFFKN